MTRIKIGRMNFGQLFLLFIMTMPLIFSAYTSLSTENSMRSKDLFIRHCSNCHRRDGSGIKKIYPPLKNSDYIKNNDTQELLRGMIYGRSGKIVVNGISYNGVMTTELDKSVSDADAAFILTYVYNVLNGINKIVGEKEVKEARKAGKLPVRK